MSLTRNRSITLANNIEQLVEHGYCVGCGLCAAVCPDDGLKMSWNQFGALEPIKVDNQCADCQICAEVCPFADGVIEGVVQPNEDEIGERIFGNTLGQKDRHIGYYQEVYAGFAEENRLQSTSGGMTTWILTSLLESDLVDKVICVHPGDADGPLFEYRVCSTVEEVKAGAKSRYYPVHLAEILKIVLSEQARYAVVALPCILKGIRLAQLQLPALQERIVFCVGIFCGGLKTAHFTEFLAAQLGVQNNEISNPQYRIKHEGPGSRGYYFGCSNPSNPGELLELRVNRLRDLWGPGFFKPNVCDYCDDVVAEVADISTGDAWIQPYTTDWRGTNIVITRSDLAQSLIQRGLSNQLLTLEKITPEQVYKSQIATFEHRRVGLAYRLYWAADRPVPRKRVHPQRPGNPIHAIIYQRRMQVRAESHEAWLMQRDTTGTQIFDRLIHPKLNSLRRWQYIDRQLRKITKWISRLVTKS